MAAIARTGLLVGHYRCCRGQWLSEVAEPGPAVVGLPIRRPGTRHLTVGWLGRHLPQDLSVRTDKAPIRDLLPLAAGGIVHGVIEPLAASLPPSLLPALGA